MFEFLIYKQLVGVIINLARVLIINKCKEMHVCYRFGFVQGSPFDFKSTLCGCHSDYKYGC